MQLVHFDSKSYPDFETAVRLAPDGIVIVAFQYDISITSNRNYAFLIEQIHKIRNPGQKTPVTNKRISDLFSGFDTKHNYFSYHGSLTRPPCSNSVTWIVFKEPIFVSKLQVRFVLYIIQFVRFKVMRKCSINFLE